MKTSSISTVHVVLQDMHTYQAKLGYIICEGRKLHHLYLYIYLLIDKSNFIIKKENCRQKEEEALLSPPSHTSVALGEPDGTASQHHGTTASTLNK